MQSIYKSYKCGSCKREIILLADEVDEAIRHGKYLVCAYCSCKHLKKLKETYDLNECFENSEKKK